MTLRDRKGSELQSTTVKQTNHVRNSKEKKKNAYTSTYYENCSVYFRAFLTYDSNSQMK